jgi:alkylation response protein AidB-like acyl-CoA dehydrogenase
MCRANHYEAAFEMMAGHVFKTEASTAKLVAGEAAMDNVRDATQVFGGYGFMNEPGRPALPGFDDPSRPRRTVNEGERR